MHASMNERRLFPVLEQRLAAVPAVALLGPRQAGKTTLALALGEARDALYLDLDLESEQDRANSPSRSCTWPTS